MPRWAENKMPSTTKRQHFDLIHAGHKGADGMQAATGR